MTTTQSAKATTAQFGRYILVGGMNTGVTLLTIFVLKSLLGVNPYLSNAAGYVAGLINSFLWNRLWVFRSKGHTTHEALHFLVGFAACYLLQLFIVWSLTSWPPVGDILWHIRLPWSGATFTLSGYGIVTIFAMGIYTIANYLYNRLVTFRHPRPL